MERNPTSQNRDVGHPLSWDLDGSWQIVFVHGRMFGRETKVKAQRWKIKYFQAKPPQLGW
jgi:hypothetical protein